MTAIVSPERTRFRSAIAARAVSLLCIGLVACSGSTSATAAPAGGTKSPSAAPATSAVVAPTAPATSTVVAPTTPVGTGSGTGNGAKSPCTLVTQAEASDAVGQSLPGKVENVTLGTCSYTSADFSAGVDLTVGDWDSMVAASKGGGIHPATALSGVGDEALCSCGADSPLLYVRKGSAGFLIWMNGADIQKLPDHGLAKTEALAALVLSRL